MLRHIGYVHPSQHIGVHFYQVIAVSIHGFLLVFLPYQALLVLLNVLAHDALVLIL
jgi:hypothetical protein